MAALADYLTRPLTPPDPTALAAIERGPIDPRDAVPLARIDRLLDPDPLPAECGWCVLPDGCGYVAMRTPMPAVSGEMVDWWFDWHPRDPIRYRVWHPPAHESNSVELPAAAGAKPHWGAVHHPVEDVGTGTVHARIAFHPPAVLGFSAGALERPAVATIVCGLVGDDRRRMQHTKMAHVFLRDDGGVVLRSCFWLGAAIRPYAPEPLARLGERLLNRPAVRRRMVPRAVMPALGRHCAEEYSNLAALLPDLHARFAAAA